MEINHKYHKSCTINKWKRCGVIHDDYESLYETYINTFNCQHCSKPFKNTKDRHLDHDHKTGLFRLIVCQTCNCHDSYIKYPDGYNRQIYYERTRDKHIERAKLHYEDNKIYITEYKKQYHQKNKERVNTKKAEFINCGCGIGYTLGHRARHFKSKIHLAYLDKK